MSLVPASHICPHPPREVPRQGSDTRKHERTASTSDSDVKDPTLFFQFASVIFRGVAAWPVGYQTLHATGHNHEIRGKSFRLVQAHHAHVVHIHGQFRLGYATLDNFEQCSGVTFIRESSGYRSHRLSPWFRSGEERVHQARPVETTKAFQTSHQGTVACDDSAGVGQNQPAFR